MKLGLPRSQFGQVALAHVVTIILVALALSLAMSHMLRRTAASYQAELLRGQADQLVAGMSADAQGWHLRLSRQQLALYAAGVDGRAYALLGDDGRVILASPRSEPAIRAKALRHAPLQLFSAGPVRGLTRPIVRGDRHALLVVSQDNNDPQVVTDDVVRAFLSRLLWLLLPVLAALPLINLFVLRRSTQAVRALSVRAAGIGPTNLDLRLPVALVPTEVAPLAIATNKALDRLQEGFRSQSEFVANVAHELRTPLASLRLRVDAIDDADQAAGMRATLDRAAHVVTQLLDLASLERLDIDKLEQFDLAETAQAIVAEAAPAIYEGGRSIELIGADAPLRVRGRSPLIGLALTNLLDNAVRHTPVGTQITLRVVPTGEINVEDNGLGLSEPSLSALAQRFWRADQSRSDSAGIGLSIVERILASHGTALIAENRADGGARFRFNLTVVREP
ncbi:sensor histidine kinase [Sphingomonas sp. MMS24-J13]|uniref:sensor histidine kinase n=1 Tax=Sphingomonas sp. MMS24-J13 TaxID=3238686 RepID=UPI00384DFA4B